jgi:2-polyprenyl-6-methoxyphenol hydroxylase-like FAD-dependent oxidoreductase
MSTSEKFTVAIVGGGLAGLAVAVHLETLGIEWFMLESYEEMAPELGASIGLAPNGMQVLDQLGVYDEVAAAAGTASSVAARDGDGRLMYEFELLPRMRANHGFDMRFTERRTVLKILYEKIKAKEKVHTGQRVSKIEHIDDGAKVRLTTREGATYTADIVIGADGIHSPVRAEMWRIAAEDGSKVFGENPGADVATEYGCTFGISEPLEGLKEGMIRHIHLRDSAAGFITGRDDVIYWFHFFKLPEKHMGIDFPRLTKAQEEELNARDAHREINPGTTWGDIYAAKRISIITPLPNHRFTRWHHRRIICVGDAVCKSQPIAGQGGCSALESSVALVDCIHAALQANGGLDKPLSDAQVDEAFTKTTAVRAKRSAAVVDEGLLYMRLAAWSNMLLRFVDTWIVPLVPKTTLVDLMFAGAAGGYHSNTLPAPVAKYDSAGELITAAPKKAVSVGDASE